MCNSTTKMRQLSCLTNGLLDSLPDTKLDDSVGGGIFLMLKPKCTSTPKN